MLSRDRCAWVCDGVGQCSQTSVFASVSGKLSLQVDIVLVLIGEIYMRDGDLGISML